MHPQIPSIVTCQIEAMKERRIPPLLSQEWTTLDLPLSCLANYRIQSIRHLLLKTIEKVPHLLRKIYGPYNYQRKKLAAARSVTSMMMMVVNLNTVTEWSAVLSSDLISHWVIKVVSFSILLYRVFSLFCKLYITCYVVIYHNIQFVFYHTKIEDFTIFVGLVFPMWIDHAYIRPSTLGDVSI